MQKSFKTEIVYFTFAHVYSPSYATISTTSLLGTFRPRRIVDSSFKAHVYVYRSRCESPAPKTILPHILFPPRIGKKAREGETDAR